MISEEQFWKGPDAIRRDENPAYKDEVTDEIRANAADTVLRYNAVIAEYEADTGEVGPSECASGWRPKSVNESTPGSAGSSHHMEGNAEDGRDTKDGKFAWWCHGHQDVLAKHGVWMEHPVATVDMAKETPWCHLQRVAPKSGARSYFPTVAAYQMAHEKGYV